MDDVRVTAKRLYGLPSDEFVATRDREVRAARSAGDTELAKALGGLRKPSAGAAALNRLARSRPSLIEDVMELGELLRAAQPSGDAAGVQDGAALRRLADSRRTLVARSVREARAVARDDGRTASPATLIDVEDTIRAALADARAALALRDGMLLIPLSPAGFGPVDITGATALGPPPPAPSRPKPSSQRESSTPDSAGPGVEAKSSSAVAGDRAREKDARAQARKAARAVTAAATEARAARTSADRAEKQARRLRRDLDDLRSRVVDLETEVSRANQHVTTLREAAEVAESCRSEAEQAQEQADSEVHGLH